MKTEVIRIEGPGGLEGLTRVAKSLRGGAIVAFPTETVYGLGVNAELPQTLERLKNLKRRPVQKEFTVHIADVEQLTDLVHPKTVTSVARRLMDRCWPGPLTVVFERERKTGKSIGVRLPDHEVARELIRRAGCRVLAPSANVSGEEPARTADEVLKSFDGKIETVLDGGRTKLGTSSTVVRLKGDGYEVLREGAISVARLKQVMNRSVLFVCSGNSCRSPLAEVIFRKLMSKKLGVKPEDLSEHGWEVSSAGTGGGFARPASEEARAVAREMGMDLSNHLSQRVDRRLVEAADVVYVMTAEQRRQVLDLAPQAQDKVMLLDPSGRPVADPHGGDLETYRRCAFVIEKALRKRIEQS